MCHTESVISKHFVASDTTDVSSAERCLGDSVVLLVKQDVGSQKVWLLPQLPWEAGETLRQTAERALTSLPGNVPASLYTMCVRQEEYLTESFWYELYNGFYSFQEQNNIQIKYSDESTDICIGLKQGGKKIIRYTWAAL